MHFFTVFMSSFVIFLNVLRWNLPKFSQYDESGGKQILNTNKVALWRQFFHYLQIYVFYHFRKTGQIDFPEKWTPTKVNIYHQSAKFYGISMKETRENSLSVLPFVLMLMLQGSFSLKLLKFHD